MPRCRPLVVLGSLVIALAAALGPLALDAPFAGAATPSCSSVTITVLNKALGIDAAHVTTVHPATPVGALICSYYGASGRIANEATINYVPASAQAFAAVEASLAKTHAITAVSGIQSAAYTYRVAPNTFFYVEDGPERVQIYADVSLAKLEKLARKLPGFS